MHNRYGDVSPSQSTIAALLGITRQHCNKLIHEMEELGLISINYRHMTSCQYKLSPFFFNPSVRSRLRHIITIFKKMALSLLFSVVPFFHSSSDMTQLNKKLNKNLLTNNKCNLTNRSRREVMKPFEQKDYGDKPISPTLQSLSCLNLTKAGQIRLTPFPDEAIVEAANAIKYAKNIKDPFNWFFKLCLDYCKRNEIAPDWPYMHTLMEKYKIKPDMPPLKILTQPVCDKTSHTQTVDKPSIHVKSEVRPPMYKTWENPKDKISVDVKIAMLEKDILEIMKALEAPVVYAPSLSYAQRLLKTAQVELAALKEKHGCI